MMWHNLSEECHEKKWLDDYLHGGPGSLLSGGPRRLLKKTWLVIITCSLVVLLGAATSLLGAGPDDRLQETLVDYVAKYGNNLSFKTRKTVFIDLNGDRIDDALVYLTGPEWCGTGGCTMLVFKGTPNGFTFVSDVALVTTRVLVSENRTNGWRDLVLISSGGGYPTKQVSLKFDGKKYPDNPSMQPALPKNQKLRGVVFCPQD